MNEGGRELIWTLVTARSTTFGVRVLFGFAQDAVPFATWMRANGWVVEVNGTNPKAFGRTAEEEEIAARLVAAFEKWNRVAHDSGGPGAGLFPVDRSAG